MKMPIKSIIVIIDFIHGIFTSCQCLVSLSISSESKTATTIQETKPSYSTHSESSDLSEESWMPQVSEATGKEPEEIIALLTAKLNEAQAQWTKAQELN